MKFLTLVLSLLLATSAFGMYAPSKKHCGTIYMGEHGVHIQVTMDNTPGDGEVDVFDKEYLFIQGPEKSGPFFILW